MFKAIDNFDYNTMSDRNMIQAILHTHDISPLHLDRFPNTKIVDMVEVMQYPMIFYYKNLFCKIILNVPCANYNELPETFCSKLEHIISVKLKKIEIENIYKEKD